MCLSFCELTPSPDDEDQEEEELDLSYQPKAPPRSAAPAIFKAWRQDNHGSMMTQVKHTYDRTHNPFSPVYSSSSKYVGCEFDRLLIHSRHSALQAKTYEYHAGRGEHADCNPRRHATPPPTILRTFFFFFLNAFLFLARCVLAYLWFLSVAGLAEGACFDSTCLGMRDGYIRTFKPKIPGVLT